jgi:hypothetical protein
LSTFAAQLNCGGILLWDWFNGGSFLLWHAPNVSGSACCFKPFEFQMTPLPESSMVRVWMAPVIEIRNAFLRAGISTQEYDSRIGDGDAPTLAQTRATIPARRTNQIATAP